nr:PREDICTED: kinesin-like protein subito isoform X1 [Megachile rotundata]
MEKDKSARPSTSSSKTKKCEVVQFQPKVETYLRTRASEMASSIHYFIDTVIDLIERGQETSNIKLFNKIFKPDSSQSDVFDNTVRKQIINLVNGESSTVIVAGLPNSGKTYTFMGNKDNPGILPNAIKLLFDLVKEEREPKYKVTADNKITALTKKTKETEREKRLNLCRIFGFFETQIYLNNSGSGVPPSNNGVDNDHKDLFSVWLSAVAYDGQQYTDLLTDKPCTIKTNMKDALYFNSDFIHVPTALEACQILIDAKSKSEELRTQNFKPEIFFTFKLIKYQLKTSKSERKPIEQKYCGTITFYCTSVNMFNMFNMKEMITSAKNFKDNFNHGMNSIRTYVSVNSSPIYSHDHIKMILREALLGRQLVTFIGTIDVTPLSIIHFLHDLPILKPSS